MFGWFKNRRDPKKSGAEKEAEEKRGYNRRQFLRGSFIRDALDVGEPERAASKASQTARSQAEKPAPPPVDLLSILSQLDPHASERQLPPGVDELNPRRRGTIPVLRPPGAVAEHDFLQLCTLCNACQQACPHEAIIAAPARFRQAAGTPMIDLPENPCMMCADTPCISACETGALGAALPEPARESQQPARHKIGVAMIQQFSCLAYNQSFCTVCAERCPEDGAIELTQNKPRIIAQNCTGCGLCHSVCPAPMNAIMIMPNPNRPAAQPAAE